MKKLRHDIKHHLIELSAMAQQNENKDMLKYLEEMNKFMLNPAEKVSTGNREIDGILNYMLRQDVYKRQVLIVWQVILCWKVWFLQSVQRKTLKKMRKKARQMMRILINCIKKHRSVL